MQRRRRDLPGRRFHLVHEDADAFRVTAAAGDVGKIADHEASDREVISRIGRIVDTPQVPENLSGTAAAESCEIALRASRPVIVSPWLSYWRRSVWSCGRGMSTMRPRL